MEALQLLPGGCPGCGSEATVASTVNVCSFCGIAGCGSCLVGDYPNVVHKQTCAEALELRKQLFNLLKNFAVVPTQNFPQILVWDLVNLPPEFKPVISQEMMEKTGTLVAVEAGEGLTNGIMTFLALMPGLREKFSADNFLIFSGKKYLWAVCLF